MVKYTLFLFGCLLFTFPTMAQRSNCAAYPDVITLTQPNGTTFSAYIKGNEMLHRYESVDGYTVLQNPAAGGQYEYAVLNIDGDLVPGGIAAQPTADGLVNKQLVAKGLTFSNNQIKAARESFYKNDMKRMGKAANGDFPSTGTNKLLVVLMQFPDEPALYSKQQFIDLLTQEGYNVNGGTGSFKEFYEDNSFNQLNLDITVIGWYTASRNRLAYGRTDASGADNPNYAVNVHELVRQAVDSAESMGIDFADYDNNKDGELDGLMLFHSGYGAEQGRNGYIWSHRWSLWSGNRTYDGVNINNYCINPAKRDFGQGVTQVRVGVATHEFGHILGLPDLYDTEQTSEGAGNWCLMAGGPWMNSERTPCQMNAWCKSELGWLTPTTLTAKGNYQLKHSLDSNIAFRVNTPENSEYFLLENRQQKGWDRFLPGRGMAIWHINTNAADRYSMFGSNDVNTDTSMFGVGIEQADGLRELERDINRGNNGDLFPGSTNNRAFTPTSNPSSNLHVWENGTRKPSNVFITNITQRLDSMITFDLGGKALAMFGQNRVNACSPSSVSFVNSSTFGVSYKWNFGDGNTSTETNPSHVYTTPGLYNVTLVVYDSANIAVDSTSMELPVLLGPTASFTVTREGNRLRFTNTSSNADYYLWKFGTNTTSSAANPVVTLTGTGTVAYSLIAFSNNGCTDTIESEVPLYPTSLNELANTIGLTAYPNPIETQLNLIFTLAQAEPVRITITNLLGEVVWVKEWDALPAGLQRHTIEPSLLGASGVYLLHIQSTNQYGNCKVMKK